MVVPNIWKHKIHVPNHQPATHIVSTNWQWLLSRAWPVSFRRKPWPMEVDDQDYERCVYQGDTIPGLSLCQIVFQCFALFASVEGILCHSTLPSLAALFASIWDYHIWAWHGWMLLWFAMSECEGMRRWSVISSTLALLAAVTGKNSTSTRRRFGWRHPYCFIYLVFNFSSLKPVVCLAGCIQISYRYLNFSRYSFCNNKHWLGMYLVFYPVLLTETCTYLGYESLLF